MCVKALTSLLLAPCFVSFQESGVQNGQSRSPLLPRERERDPTPYPHTHTHTQLTTMCVLTDAVGTFIVQCKCLHFSLQSQFKVRFREVIVIVKASL